MKTVFVLLMLFLFLGLCVQKFQARTRLLLITLIIGMILFITYT